MKKALVLIILSLLGISSLFAQSTFFEKGQSGFGIYGGIQESYWEDGYFGSIGFSYKGIIELGITYRDFKYDKDNWESPIDKNPTESAVAFELDYWFLRTRTGADRGIDVGLWTEYEMENYKDYPYYNDSDTTKLKSSNGFSFGPEFSINFDINDKWFLQPFLWIGYASGNVKYEDESIVPDEDKKYKGGCGSIGVALARKFANGNSIVFIFEQESDAIDRTNDTAYKFSVGYNFGF